MIKYIFVEYGKKVDNEWLTKVKRFDTLEAAQLYFVELADKRISRFTVTIVYESDNK